MKVSKSRVLTFVLMLALAGSFVLAQVPNGKFEGKVSDDQGNPLPGVTVEAIGPKMVGKASTITDAKGDYRLFGIPSGTYEVTFALQGFKKLIRKDIIMQLGQTVVLNPTLEPAAIEESVTVVGMSPLIDVKSTVKGQTMTKEVFMSLPRSRNFDGLISTVPGVQYDQVGGGLLVDGASGSENMWYMDGTDITNMHIGTRAQGAVMELVEEVKVTASGYEAQYGGSMGGVVNVITRSGGNAFHGDILGYYENHSQLMQGKSRQYLREDPYVDNLFTYVNDDDLLWDGGKNRDPYYRLEGVFNLGGYILKDKLWFFGSFNPVYSSNKGQARWFTTDPAQTKSDYYAKTWNWNGQAKLTAAPIQGMRISASWVNNFYKYKGAIPSIYGTSSQAYPWANEGWDYPNMSAAGTLDYSIGNNLLISARGGYAMQNQTNPGVTPPGAIYTFGYTNAIYKDVPGYDPALERFRGFVSWPTWQVIDKNLYEKISGNVDLTYYLRLGGDHAFKAGFQWMRLHEDVLRGAVTPRVTLNWGQGYYGLGTGEPVLGTYGNYQIRGSWTSPYGYVWNIHSTNMALYLQDSWTIGGKLTFNFGVRAESEYIPSFSSIPQYKDIKAINFNFGDKIAPRLGLIYDVFGDSSLKVFGSFGYYYDVMKLYIAEGSLGGFQWITDYYELNTLDWTVIAASGKIDDRTSQEAGGRYVGSMNWRIPSFDTVDPALKPTLQREISFGAEKKVMENLSLSFRVVNKHLIRTIEDVGVLTPLGEVYYQANPGFGYTLLIKNGGQFEDKFWQCPKATREYWGLNVSLEKRFSNNWQGGINYTLSRVAGNYGGLASSDEANRTGPNNERYFDLWFLAFDLSGDVLKGPLVHDRTHYIKAYGSYVFPFGLTVGVTAYGRSGRPLQTELFGNNVQGWFPNNRADLGRLPFTLWSDLYLEYTFRFSGRYSASLNLQVNNWTNTKTWQFMNTIPNRNSMDISDDEILTGNFDWQAKLNSAGDPYYKNGAFKKYTTQFDSWGARLGARFSF
jgi:hypothetical protein